MQGLVTRPGERPARVARAGLRRRRSLLALSRRRRGRADPAGARRVRQPRARGRHRRRRRRHRAGPGRAAVRDPDRVAARPEGRPGPHAAADRRARSLAPAQLGDFSLRPQQGDVRAVFVPLKRLQQDLESAGRVNTLLVVGSTASGRAGADRARAALLQRQRVALEDYRADRCAPLDDAAARSRSRARAGLLDAAARRRAAERGGGAPGRMRAAGVHLSRQHAAQRRSRGAVFAGDRASICGSIAPALTRRGQRDAARDAADRPQRLDGARSGGEGRRSADARLLRLGRARPPGDAHAPTSRSPRSCRSPAPPPIAISRRSIPASPTPTRSATGIRRFRSICGASGRVDEDYWKQYRTTPKAFIPLEVGQRLWRSRYGDRTSVRIAARRRRSRWPTRAIATRRALRARARSAGAWACRCATCARDGLAASRGATDFGEYFTYFSFFLVASALLLAALFFRLGVEQRAREVGLLRAVGFTHAARPAAVRRRRAAARRDRQRCSASPAPSATAPR